MQLATNTNGFLSLGNAVISIYSFYFKYVSQYNQRATIPDGLCSSPEKLCHSMCPVVSRVRLPFQYYIYYMRLVYSHDLCRFCQYCLKTMVFLASKDFYNILVSSLLTLPVPIIVISETRRAH